MHKKKNRGLWIEEEVELEKKRPREQTCTHRPGWKIFLRLDGVEEKGFGELLPCVAFHARHLEN